MTMIPIIPTHRLPPAVLEVLACPHCHAKLIWHSPAHEDLYCRYCHCLYPIVEGVARLRPDDAKRINPPTHEAMGAINASGLP